MCKKALGIIIFLFAAIYLFSLTVMADDIPYGFGPSESPAKSKNLWGISDDYFKITTQELTKNDMLLLEQKIHTLINIQRHNYGLSDIVWNDKLAQIARKHSEDMVKRNYFDHFSPEGRDFSYRYAQAGYNCRICAGNYCYLGAENLYQGSTFKGIWYENGKEVKRDWYSLDEIAKMAVDGWMNSPGHRVNILDPIWKSEGIGVAVSKDGKVLITENFC